MEPYSQPYPAQREPASSAPPRRRGVVLSLLVVVLLLAIAFVLVYVQSERGARIERAQTIERLFLHAQTTCAQKKEPQVCTPYALTELALAQEDAVFCDYISEDARDGCFWSLSAKMQNSELCERIQSPDDALSCLDAQRAQKAQNASDVSLCALVETASARLTCEDRLLGPLTPETCLQRGRSNEECVFLSVLTRALKQGDATICAELSIQEQEICERALPPVDQDLDGLFAEEELLYGTLDTNPDSDGDGFSDGEEVRSGYNPNGSGTL